MSRTFDKRWTGGFVFAVISLIGIVVVTVRFAFPHASAVAPMLSGVTAMAIAGVLVAATAVMFMQWVVAVQNLHGRWIYGHAMSPIEVLRARSDRAGYFAMMLLTGLASVIIIRFVTYSPVAMPQFAIVVIVILVAVVACISLARATMHDTGYRRELAKNVLY